MANIKVSEMTEATVFDDGDYAMIVQANQNKKISKENMLSDIPTIQNDISTINNNIGNLANLATEDKTSIVNSINELVPITLYNNSSGTTGNVTLSDNVSNYAYLEIFFKDEKNSCSSIKICNPNGKNASLNTTYITSGKIQFYAKIISISDTIVSNINGYTLIIQQSSFNGYNNSNDYILITKILGYK